MLTNRKAGSFAWAPDVRKPGLPPNTRRLGDLRLECQVDRAASLMVRPKPAVYYLIEATVDVCSSYPGGRLYYGERAIFNVTLTHGERRQVLLSERLYASKAPTAVLMLCDFYPLLIDRVYLIALPAVVGIEIPIERLIGKLKASQDEALPDRWGTVAALRAAGTPAAATMASLVEQEIKLPAGA